MASPPSADPYQGTVTFHYANGTGFNVPLRDLDSFILYSTRVSINYSAQLGASLILVILLALLTSPEKRRSLIFALNASALVFNFARLLCMSIYFTTAFSMPYIYFSGEYFRVPMSAYACSILGVVFSFLLVVAVEFSLVLQTQVICATLPEVRKYLLLGVSLVIALVAVTFRLVLTVQNTKFILNALDFSSYIWLQEATAITITISICFFSLIFITKLGIAINSRRHLGITRFGAMQVIFVMSCQTMVIPAICCMIQFSYPQLELNTNALTIMAISLPLSSLWAAATIKHTIETANSTPHQYLWPSSRNNSVVVESKPGSFSGQATTVRSGGSVAASSLSPDQLDRLYPELEAGKGD
ncbi:hypothetical protein FQN52_007727 [Onygenales sp. PD_12]|nr:hypothetical protein FQN52_007727 [Onygenales sp. PD_12]KAK2788050.1 hypothetical protein FQN51_003045 [Onygenales sp. PD_10]